MEGKGCYIDYTTGGAGGDEKNTELLLPSEVLLVEGAPDSADAVVATLDRGAFERRRDGVAGRVEQELGFLEDRGWGQVADADLFRAAIGWGVVCE